MFDTEKAERSVAEKNVRRWYRTTRLALLAAVVLFVIGGLIANTSQTDGGRIRVVKVTYPTPTGNIETGLLYIPSNATSKTPACGVVAIEGYINTVDTMDSFSIEMARRGCVVLDANQTGQGTSVGASFTDGFGGPPSLAFLNSLSIVRKGDVGLVGHSMGGWASVLAAGLSPAGSYRSVVLVSSSTSTPVVEPIPGTPKFPRNIEVVEARYSEFSQLMWAEPKGSLFPVSPRLQALFGTKSPIQTGKVYGSIAAGTGRKLILAGTTHPGMTFDPAATRSVISWEQATLAGVSPLNPGNQIWLWDEFGCLLALFGVVLFMFGAAGELARVPYFASVTRSVPENRSVRGKAWWLSAAILAAIGPLTFFIFQECVNGNRNLSSSRQLKIEQPGVHCSSVAAAGTRPRSRLRSR